MVDIEPLLECLSKYNKYVSLGWDIDPLGVVLTTIEVCKRTGLQPFVLCEMGVLHLWRSVLDKNGCSSAWVFNNANTHGSNEFSHDGFLMLKDGYYVPTLKFKEASVLFVFNIHDANNISKKTRAIMQGVMMNNRKFCAITNSRDDRNIRWRSSVLYEICMSVYIAKSGRNAMYNVAELLDELEKCGATLHRAYSNLNCADEDGMRTIWELSMNHSLEYTILPPIGYAVDVRSHDEMREYDDRAVAKMIRGVVNTSSSRVILIMMRNWYGRVSKKLIKAYGPDVDEYILSTYSLGPSLSTLTELVSDNSSRLIVVDNAILYIPEVLGMLGEITVVAYDGILCPNAKIDRTSLICPRTGNVHVDVIPQPKALDDMLT